MQDHPLLIQLLQTKHTIPFPTGFFKLLNTLENVPAGISALFK
jgi:hypothetical protein